MIIWLTVCCNRYTSDAAQQVLDQLGDGEMGVSLPEFEHQLTHFRLIITPQPAELYQPAASRAAESHGVWLTVDQAIAAGVPTPVRRLLNADPGAQQKRRGGNTSQT